MLFAIAENVEQFSMLTERIVETRPSNAGSPRPPATNPAKLFQENYRLSITEVIRLLVASDPYRRIYVPVSHLAEEMGNNK